MARLRFAVAVLGAFLVGLAIGSGVISARYATAGGSLAIGLVLKDPR